MPPPASPGVTHAPENLASPSCGVSSLASPVSRSSQYRSLSRLEWWRETMRAEPSDAQSATVWYPETCHTISGEATRVVYGVGGAGEVGDLSVLEQEELGPLVAAYVHAEKERVGTRRV